MKQLRKFLSLPGTDQHLLIASIILLGTITLALRVAPFQKLWYVISRLAQQPAWLWRPYPAPAERVAWAVRHAGHCIPAATCLPQALTGLILLKRRGYPAKLFFGVAKNEAGRLEAHAWVENEGKIVIGGLPDLARYTPLPSLEMRHYERYRWYILP